MAVNVRGGALEFDAIINNSQFKAQIDQMESRLIGLTKAAEREAKAVDNLVKNTATAIAGYISLSTAANFIGDVVRIRGEFQQLEIAFRTMLKSKVQADQLMAEAVQLAAKTPFSLQDVGSGAKQLLAYGFAANDVTKNIEMLGNVAAGVGAPLNDIIYLYGTLKTQGQVFNRDILQFTQRGIPIVAELANVMGTSEKAIKGMVEAGKIGFPEVRLAFENLTSESGKFYNLMQEQSKSLSGQVSNLQDAWSRMMNEIGKSNEGILNNALGTALKIVENYQEVIKIIKILVAVYGTYRAALIVTNALMLTQAEVVAGVTVAQKLHYGALVLAQRAQALLNTTMLANPYVAAATALAGLLAVILVFNKEATRVKTTSELIAEGTKNANSSFDEQKAKIREITGLLKDQNLTEEQRRKLLDQLAAINPKIVAGIDAKAFSMAQLTKNTAAYLEELRKQIQLEGSEEAYRQSLKQEDAIRAKIDLAKQLNAENKKNGSGNQIAPLLQGTTEDAGQKEVKRLEGLLTAQQNVTKEIEQGISEIRKNNGEALTEAEKKTVAYYDKTIKELKDERDQVSQNSAKYQEYTKRIKDLESARRKITGETEKKTPEETAAQKAKTALDELRKDIADAEYNIFESGLTQEQAEVARIEQKYEKLRERARELKANEGIFFRIDNAEAAELGAEKTADRVRDYRTYISEQEQLFKNFEDLKLQYGTEKAKELTGNQAAEYSDYVTFLKTQLALLKNDNSAAGKQKREAVAAALTEAEKKQLQADTDYQIEQFKRVTEATTSFNQRRKQIEEQFQKDLAVLRKNYTGTDLEERENVLREARDQELADLNSAAARSSGIYKKLNEDILLYTRQQLINRKKELEKYLATTMGIPPAVRKDVQDYIDQIDGVIKDTSDGFIDPKKAQKLAQDLQQISGGLSTIAGSIREGNAELADMLDVMSEITSVASNVVSAFGKFASGDIIGGISASIGAIVGVFKIFSDARKSQKKAQQEMEAFQLKMLTSEVDINILYRERELQQIKINRLRLEGIKAESSLLKQQATQNQQDYNRIFALLQKEQYIAGQREEKYGGFLGIGRKTRIVNVYASLAGKTYEDLEKLFLSGQLEGKAAELFKTLEKLKQAGVDIDAALQQNAEAAKQIFTGTTADSITDQIADGFANGLRSAADFANSFEDLMRGAILNALKYQTLEGPLKEFYEAFAANAESDGVLTEEEIKQLRENFNSIISNAGARFDELKKITNIDFNNAASQATQQKGLAGAIRGITEEQAELLAGQFGGLRLTAVDHLRVSQQGLLSLQKIENYTGNLVQVRAVLERIELSGIKLK